MTGPKTIRRCQTGGSRCYIYKPGLGNCRHLAFSASLDCHPKSGHCSGPLTSSGWECSPQVVDCLARTGLDMLAKHHSEAIGFDIVFLLQDSKDDFAPYTEFLCYGIKEPCRCCKISSKVLKVVGPERLYGVVLKLPQQAMLPPGTVHKQNIQPPHSEYSLTRPKEEHFVNSSTKSAEFAQPGSGLSSVRHLLAEPHFQSIEQLGNQYNPKAQPLTHHYASMSSTPSQSAQMLLGNKQFQESTASLFHQGMVCSRPSANFSIAPQTASVAGGESAPNNRTSVSNQVDLSYPQNVVTQSADEVNLEHPNHVQQFQSVLSGAGQGTFDGEVDKNQQYQSTLQFAANLLPQIQWQQQTNSRAERGTGNQQ
ncbi:hypothetical protein WN943_016182 [Citrus x changshan-huyou]